MNLNKIVSLEYFKANIEEIEKMISSAIGLFLPVVLALVSIIYLTIKENKRK